MSKKISWRRFAPLAVLSVFAAGLAVFSVATPSSAHDRGRWDGNKDTQYFLKLEGIDGGSNDSKHRGEIELNSYRLMENEPDTGEVATRLAPLGDNNLRFLADSSKASPALFEKAQTGDTIASAVLSIRKGGQSNDYMTVKLTDVVIASYQNSGHQDDDGVDEVLLNYGTVQIEYNEGTPIRHGWDFHHKRKM
jgi:type VI secretion system secreted protein Hcp